MYVWANIYFIVECMLQSNKVHSDVNVEVEEWFSRISDNLMTVILKLMFHVSAAMSFLSL